MTATVPDVLGWLRTRAIADAAGDGAMFQEAATLLYDFKINAKALLVYCDSTGSGDAIYSLQCLRRLVERMESPNWSLEIDACMGRKGEEFDRYQAAKDTKLPLRHIYEATP